MSKIKNGDNVSVHYTGKLEDGTVFDTSLAEGREPLTVTLGQGQLEHDENGALVRRRSLVSVARQNGKTVALKAFILWALVKEPIRRGKPVLVISTAHQLDLAVEIFEQLAPLLEAKFGAKAYWSYGRNEVVMPDESRWLVQAATPKAFHGFSPTYIVADEVWNISSDVLFNGALPSQRAMQSPLLSCWSTAGTEDSHAMLKMREEGLRAIDEKKFSKLFFAEWSVPPGVDPLEEKGYWAMANPAIGYTLDPEILVDESEQVDKAAFMRASLNLWISSANSWLNPGVFDKLVTATMPDGGVLSVDSSIDESLYCGIRAQLNDEGQIAVTVEFVTDTLGACWEKVHESAKTCRQIALTPSLFQMAPMDLANKKMINEAPEINVDWGGAYKGHFVKGLNVVQGGKPFLEIKYSDGSSKKYKVTTNLGDVNFKNIWMSGDKLNVEFYSGGGGKTTTVEIPGNKTYGLFENLKNKPGQYTVETEWNQPSIKFYAA